MTRVKVCGITNLDDAHAAVDAGADALGFVFADSPRRISAERARAIVAALPPLVTTVGVFVNAAHALVRQTREAARLDLVQLHGDEPPEYCALLDGRVIKRLAVRPDDTPEVLRMRLAPYRVRGCLLDPGGGSGQTFRWELARGLNGPADRPPPPLIIAGGLTPENVAEVIRIVRPYAVDVSSGVEAAPGRKDADKLRAFVRAVRQSDAT